ncbi:MAG TPA: mobilization protein, partial [Dyadobacter sp.]|nr:mobilization protein [Dyadobacter sp.]
DAITAASQTARNWEQLEASLRTKGVHLVLKYKSGTDQIQGISFSKGEVKMKGSKIDRSLSYGRINEKILQNQKQLVIGKYPFHVSENPDRAKKQLPFQGSVGRMGYEENLLKELMSPIEQHSQTDPYTLRKRKSKRKYKRQSL